MMRSSLRISGLHHIALQRHLFPGDGFEAVAFGLCGRLRTPASQVLTVQDIVPVPYAACDRRPDRVSWSSETLASILDDARRRKQAGVKFHSHPSSYENFSPSDDQSDTETFASVFSWMGENEPHGSAVMLPDGRIFGQSIAQSGWQPFSAITVVGDDLSYSHWIDGGEENSEIFAAQNQLFGAATTKLLRKLRVGVVGCSGTGSVVIELLARLGVGTLVLVDHERIEERNLNRIANAKRSDIDQPKVTALAEAVRSMGLGTNVVSLEKNLFDPKAVKEVAECDVVFGCMDKAEGRQLLNRIATFYLVPYFDLGVHLSADGNDGINEASGVVHYLQPGRSSLLSRKAYTPERVRAENLYRTNPEAYKNERKRGYIEGVDEKSPAVASINSTIASLAVNEFLARIHPFRSCRNGDCAIIRVNFMETLILREEEKESCRVLAPHVGQGDIDPLLDLPALSN
jgi:hypothetical protein